MRLGGLWLRGDLLQLLGLADLLHAHGGHDLRSVVWRLIEKPSRVTLTPPLES
jgi:hypothetical protein